MKDMLDQVEPLIPALRRYARSLMRDAAAADDLVQESLERVVVGWHQRRDGSLRAWLFTIVHNLAVSQFRRLTARGQHVSIDQADADAFGEAATQEHRVMYQDVLNKLQRLPEDQRAVLLLVGVEDLSYAEVAKVLDIPIGTVMSRLSRARERLRREIDGIAAEADNVVAIRSAK